MIETLRKDAELRMSKSLEALKTELAKVRTGRAHPSILDHVKVEYYGQDVPLSQVAKIVAEDARNLSVAPWEKDMVSKIEKAIMTSDLGLNPSSAGTTIRVPLPPLTEERRKLLVKQTGEKVEEARIALRNVRQDAFKEIKRMKDAKEFSEDDAKRAEKSIDDLMTTTNGAIDELFKAKERDILTI